jgi:hypothetical protein
LITLKKSLVNQFLVFWLIRPLFYRSNA